MCAHCPRPLSQAGIIYRIDRLYSLKATRFKIEVLEMPHYFSSHCHNICDAAPRQDTSIKNQLQRV